MVGNKYFVLLACKETEPNKKLHTSFSPFGCYQCSWEIYYVYV